MKCEECKKDGLKFIETFKHMGINYKKNEYHVEEITVYECKGCLKRFAYVTDRYRVYL